MNKEAFYVVNDPAVPCRPLIFDESKCLGCNTCLDVCRNDVMMPNPEKGKPPILVYTDECWFCGCCVEHCPVGAVELRHPMAGMVGWKRKETGELFRVGMKNPPQPNTRPAISGYDLYPHAKK